MRRRKKLFSHEILVRTTSHTQPSTGVTPVHCPAPLSPLVSRHLLSWQDSQQKQPDNLTQGQLCSDGPPSYPVSRTHMYPVLIAVDLMPLFAQGRDQGVLTASSCSLPVVQLTLHALSQRTVVIEEVFVVVASVDCRLTHFALMACLLSSRRLSENPFNCDCRLAWLSHWLRSKPTLGLHTRCNKPAVLARRDLVDLKREDFQCSGE